ncbi:MAG: cupredoxin domain-containing protein [Halobacteriales archaeon]|nr:cupredoxin domain-containing protein [Halobacteriales archaeon]
MARALLLLPLLLLLLPVASAGPAPSATADVSIEHFSFNPTPVAVQVGDFVQWTNNDVVSHTATSDDLSTFDTGTLAPGSSAAVRMSAAGTFTYHCNFHPTMTATVQVGDPQGLPDLLVVNMTITDVTPGVAKTVDVLVRNVGVNNAAPATVRLSYLYHGTLHTIGEAQVGPIGPLGDTAVASFAWATLGKLGDFVLVAEADSGHELDEADEDNNVGEATTGVLLAGVPGVDLLEPLG